MNAIPYKDIVENANEGVWVIDKQEITSYVNPRMAAMLGHTPEFMLGRSMYEFMPEHYKPTASNNVGKRKAGINEVHDFVLSHKDGHLVPVEMSTSPIYIGEEYSGAVALVMDITERLETQKSIQEGHERLRSLFDFSKDIIFLVDCSLNIILINHGTEGIPAEKLQGSNLREWFSDEQELKEAEQAYAAVFESGQIEEYRITSHTPLGKIIHSCRVSPIYEKNKIIGASVVARNITKQLDDQLALLNEQERFRSIFEQSVDMILLLQRQEDGQLVVESANEKYQEFFFNSPEIAQELPSLTNLPVFDLLVHYASFPVSVAMERIRLYESVMDGHEKAVVVLGEPIPEAPDFFYEARITPIKEADGSCRRVLVSMRDISHSVATSKALVASEEKFRTLFHKSILAEFEFQANSEEISFNSTAREILRIPEGINSIPIPPWVFATKLVEGGIETVLNSKEVLRTKSEFDPKFYREKYGFPTQLEHTIFLDIAIVPINLASGEKVKSFLVQMRDITEKVIAERALQKAFEELKRLRSQLELENSYLREEALLGSHFGDIIYSGNKFKEVLTSVEQVASTDATVLVLGETGTGKELIAKAIHNLSKRKSRPLIKLNCAALPKELIESELFGHEKGAFTGAIAKKIGRFELADGGTIFLDEIGELPLELQPKLLRVLQEGEFERVGGNETKKVDVRVVAATNRDLDAERQSGQFRADLYYRLNVFPIQLPPLRERREDIPNLVWFFIKKFNQKFQKHVSRIPEKLMTKLETYDWPGNVRELENLLERAMILSKSKVLSEEAFHFDRTGLSDELVAGEILNLDLVEKRHITKVLELRGWKINGQNGAAATLGLKPSTLRDRMKKLGIDRP